MAWNVEELPFGDKRMLVLVADTASELEKLLTKAGAKGWERYQQGSVPGSGRPSAWLFKQHHPEGSTAPMVP